MEKGIMSDAQEETSKNSIVVNVSNDQMANLKLIKESLALKGYEVTISELVCTAVDSMAVWITCCGIDELIWWWKHFRGK